MSNLGIMPKSASEIKGAFNWYHTEQRFDFWVEIFNETRPFEDAREILELMFNVPKDQIKLLKQVSSRAEEGCYNLFAGEIKGYEGYFCKIVRDQGDAYLDYAKWVYGMEERERDPAFPKIVSIEQLGSGNWLVVQEKLFEIPDIVKESMKRWFRSIRWQDNKQWYGFKEQILKIQKQFPVKKWDLHSNNWMCRENGEWVIIDPIH